MADQGAFIVLEGADGSGKTTQFNLLHHRLEAIGYDVEVVDFPRYDQPSSHFVRKYLTGEYGPAAQISPYTASLFYALDRYEAAKGIRKALNAGKVVLSNRFVGSNMAHQGAKFTNPVEQRGFFVWNDNLEYELLDIPRPDINIFLKVPAEISYELIAKKAERSYTKQSHDEHEKDMNHLKNAVATYDLLCKLFPKDFKEVNCVEEGHIKSVTAINNLIWDAVRPYLPQKPTGRPHGVTVNLGVVTKTGSPAPAPAAKDSPAKEAGLELNKKVSSLFLAQLDSPVAPDLPSQKWDRSVVIPEGLNKEAKEAYQKGMQILAKMYDRLEKAARAKINDKEALSLLLAEVTPLAAVRQLNVRLSDEEKARLAEDVKKIQLAEARAILKSLRAGGSDIPSGLEKLLGKVEAEGLSGDVEPVELLDASPRFEFESLVDIVYPFSSLSRDELTEQISRWSYQKKSDAFLAAAKEAGSAFSQIRYRFDVLTSWTELASFKALGLHESLKIQPATVRFGFETPKIVEKNGLDAEYEACFDESLNVFSRLQEVSGNDIAQYAVLAGHKARWQLTINAQNLFKIRSYHPKRAPLTNLLVEKIAEKHTLVAAVLNQVEEKKPQPPTKKKKSRGHRGGKSKKS